MTRSATGFTLLEMLVVLGILGLVAGIGYPAIIRATDAQAFQTASRQIDLAVRRARADAIRENRSVSLPSFERQRDAATIVLAKGPVTPAMQIEQPDGIVFYRDGTARGGIITLTSDRRRFRIVIDPQTGIVTSGAS